MAKADDVRVVPAGAPDEDLFAPLDLRDRPQPFMQTLTDIANEPEFAPEPEAPVNEFADLEEQQPPQPPPAKPEPVVIENQDGSTVTIEKTSKGWKATLDSGAGKPEVFFGATKDEMWQNVAVGKMNATRKIRELNRKVKLGSGNTTPAPAAPAETPAAKPRELSADEVFEIKTQLESNPDLAMATWFQKKTGLSVNQLVQLAQNANDKAAKGEDAKLELECEAVAKDFMGTHSDYYPTDENFASVVLWLAKYKLRRPVTPETLQSQEGANKVMNDLMRGGYWTVDNLTEAFEDLTEDGLLESAPAPEEVVEEETTPPAPAKPATPRGDGRIIRTITRPRAGAGIRATETTRVNPPAAEAPPSAEELENLSDDEIANLMRGVRQTKLRTAPRY